MPQLQTSNMGGTFTWDAGRMIVGAMHFPADQAKREALNSSFSYSYSDIIEEFDNREENYETFIPINRRKFEILWKSKTLNELVDDINKHFRDIFIAAHWLQFRVYAATHRLEWNSNGKWEHYLSYLLPLFSKGTHEWKWGWDRNSLRSAVRSFGPVAHLWAAVIWRSDQFADELLRHQKVMPRPGWFSLKPQNIPDDIMKLAQGYYQAAQHAGIYRGRNCIVPLDSVWTLPSSVEPGKLAIDHPDRLIDSGLDSIFAAYRARNSIIKRGDEAELARKMEKAKAEAKLRDPPKLPDPVKVEFRPIQFRVHRPPPPPPRPAASEA